MALNLRYFRLMAVILFLPLTLQAKEIAISFDDGPSKHGEIYTAMERSRLLVESLAQAGVKQAIFFVNGKNIDDLGKKQLKLYAQAGHLIGNHTFHHSNLRKVSLRRYLEDIHMGHKAVKKLDGFVKLFRYPHLQEGDTFEVRDRIRQELSKLGYKNGYVTVDNYDFYMNTLVAEQLRSGGRVDFEKLEKLYVEVLVEAAEFYDQVARSALGRSPKHILLLHENDLAARFLVSLVKGLNKRGWKIITVESAYSDPIAEQIPNTLYHGQGRVAALAHEKLGKEFRNETEDTEHLEQLFKTRQVFNSNPY